MKEDASTTYKHGDDFHHDQKRKKILVVDDDHYICNGEPAAACNEHPNVTFD